MRFAFIFFLGLSTALASQRTEGGPSGAPGVPNTWAPALKQAVGTAYEAAGANSPVWFTVAEGILTEVFYPSVDQPQIGDLQFLVTDGESFFSEQKKDTGAQVRFNPDGASVNVTGQDRSGRYRYEQTIITDAAAPVVRIRTTFQWAGNHPLRVFVLFKPAIGNTGAGNSGQVGADGLFAWGSAGRADLGRRGEVHAALVASQPWGATSIGYVGFSDGWQDLSRNFHLTESWEQAGPGNIALTGELPVTPGAAEFTYELALGFGGSAGQAQAFARSSLGVPFESARSAYDAGWNRYFSGLHPAIRDHEFTRRGAQVIKTHEDKSRRGAIVASLSKPAIPGGERAPDGNNGGYHLVWPRDLYHAAMGLLAAGDPVTPVDVLHYYLASQSPDGSWSQNFWVNGTPYWHGLQMDEVSFPILLTEQLSRRGVIRPANAELELVRRAARFIADHGPATGQDRWEEIGGFIPSTIAAELAALDSASRLTGDPSFADTARRWKDQLESWTLVHRGPRGTNYYLRASPTGNPDGGEGIEIANGGGHARADEIMDGGFLELVRLGIRDAHDPNVLSTLGAYENSDTGIAAGPWGAQGFRRYNRDAYGVNGVGGFWPLLAGERGHYALRSGDPARARAELAVLERSAVPSGLLPEQTFTAPPRGDAGLGVACPLVWAHAEDILLQRSLEEGAVFDGF